MGGMGVLVGGAGIGVAVGGRGVLVGGAGVLVGLIGVAVAGTGVGGTGVLVTSGVGVAVGATGMAVKVGFGVFVGVGVGVACVPHPATKRLAVSMTAARASESMSVDLFCTVSPLSAFVRWNAGALSDSQAAWCEPGCEDGWWRWRELNPRPKD